MIVAEGADVVTEAADEAEEVTEIHSVVEVRLALPFLALSFPFVTFVVIERRERNDAATMFVKNLPYSATKDGIWGLFGNDVKVRHILPT